MRKRIAAYIGIIISSIYLLNFTFGVWELPDNLPIIGNLDELAAATLLIASLKHFGIDFTNFLLPNKSRKKKGE
ncbi:DUF1232 domain-containing protein [Cryomorpha ignava]|uniref:DUF1232 domain-containing protein n=1 Tax=Cryomorpha ignava TaxID=101383 RepID=A0A7K3WS19_9FLAO|nr:DUF1232 domain-containing protein [Cryomorpha ignava]NEN24316.1 DUF1232 domain-containing protein [Cryomorpha ignava]